MAWFKKYWRPTSLTFLGGLLLIISGVLQAAETSIPGVSEFIRPVLIAYGGADPILRIGAGLGLVGISRRLPRHAGN